VLITPLNELWLSPIECMGINRLGRQEKDRAEIALS